MPAHLIDPPSMALSLHPRIRGVATLFMAGEFSGAVSVAQLTLVNYVSERAVLFESVAPAELMRQAFSPETGRLTFAADKDVQRGMLDAFLGAVTGLDPRLVEDAEEARDALAYLSWLFRQVDRAVR